jgi:transcription factor MBP1
MTPSPSASSSSRTPSPINSPNPYPRGSVRSAAETPEHEPPRNRRRTHERYPSELSHMDDAPHAYQDAASYAEQMLEYFISDTSKVPPFLVDRPQDFDPNVTIDDDGHTALHWAAAMGRIKVVKLLMTAGADMYRVNKSGQTPLMRSVMFANNYDVRKFPELYELLHRSTLNIDHHNRTVFHHVVDVAMTKGKSHAARYYMETILARLSDYPNELRDVVNFQDEDGETALTMAARCRSKRLVKQLIDVGASVKIVNNDGKSAEDYILEDERFRASPPIAPRLPRLDGGPAPPPVGPPGYADTYFKAPFSYSAGAQKASARVLGEMGALLDGLTSAFDAELRAKERDSAQAQALLAAIQAEILDSQRGVSALRMRAGGIAGPNGSNGDREREQRDLRERDLDAVQVGVRHRADALRNKMAANGRQGLERWLAEETAREHEVRIFGPGEVVAQQLAAAARDAGSGSPFLGANGVLASPVGAQVVPAPVDGGPIHGSDASPTPTHVDGSATLASLAAAAKGKAKVLAPDEDTSDLRTLYSDLPPDADSLRTQCDMLRTELVGHRTRRRDTIDATVRAKTEASTGERMHAYRRLIGAAAGGVPPTEVDAYVGMLLEVG